MMGKNVYKFTYPMVYSGLRWDHLQIGLSLVNLNREVRAKYESMIFLVLFYLMIEIIGAFFFVRRLTRPIYSLLGSTRRIAQGDLSARAIIHTKDVVSDLAPVFNNMTDTLIVASPQGTIRMINQAGLDLLGYSKTEIAGMETRRLSLSKEPDGQDININNR